LAGREISISDEAEPFEEVMVGSLECRRC